MSTDSFYEAINSTHCIHSISSSNCTPKLYRAVGGGENSTNVAHSGLMASYYCSFIIAAIAITMSSTMLFVIARLLRKRNAFLLLVANLCVADVAIACFTITQHTFLYLQYKPSELVRAQSTHFTAAEWGCAESIATQLWDASTNENLFTIMLMTLSHLVSLKWPNHSKQVVSRGGVLIAITISWLAAGLMGFTKFIVIMTTDISHEAAVQNASSFFASYCVRRQHYNGRAELREKHKTILFSASIATMLVVYISMLLIYIYIFRSVWVRMLHKHRGKNNGFLTRVRLMRRTIVTTLLLLGSFSILWLPIVIYSALRSMNVLTAPRTRDKADFDSLRVALATLVSVSGIVDPLLYGMRMLDIRNAINRYLKPRTVSTFSCVPGVAFICEILHG